MKVLIVGSGGREHAMAEKISLNNKVSKIYIAKGNAFNTLLSKVENINIEKIDELVNFAKENEIDLTIVGSEELLVAGIVDKFRENNLNIFGPDKKAALLEGSKAYSKEFMNKYGVKTAKSKTFDDASLAIEYVKTNEPPLVIKASGLALGKGVIISNNIEESIKAINEIMIDKKFSSAGDTVVIEEFLEGVEVSVLSITDSNTIIPFISAKDHKKISENETGLNTGGMGVIAPNPYFTSEVEELFIKDILNPTLKGIKEEKMNFSGIIFFGLMVTKNGVYLLEYNMRLGDPETQSVLPLMKSDFIDLIESAQNKNLNKFNIEWESKSSCCVVLVAGGYPLTYEKGNEITGIDELLNEKDTKVYLAGVKEDNNKYYTNGGRVINIVSIKDTLIEAKNSAYTLLNKINFKDKYFRKDIGGKNDIYKD